MKAEQERERVRQAISKVESAQILLREACMLISPIHGLIGEWEDIGTVYLQAKMASGRLSQSQFVREGLEDRAKAKRDPRS